MDQLVGPESWNQLLDVVLAFTQVPINGTTTHRLQIIPTITISHQCNHLAPKYFDRVDTIALRYVKKNVLTD